MRLSIVVKFLGLVFLILAGTFVVSAQVDLSGEWKPIFYEDEPERIPGPELADYLGIPINAALRMRADTWMASLLELPEWQCRPHASDYIWRGPSNITISKEQDPLSRADTWHVYWLRNPPQDLIIHMDNPPQPSSLAPHTWFGFATGKWEGDMLTVHITHLKEGYVRRNGLARSDQAMVTLHLIRHDDILTVVVIDNDPLYLTEPFIRSTDFELDVHQHVPPYPCEMVTEVERPEGVVPNWMPGTNPFLHEFANRYDLPFEATRGGAETMYPEYRKKLKQLMNPSDYNKYVLQSKPAHPIESR